VVFTVDRVVRSLPFRGAQPPSSPPSSDWRSACRFGDYVARALAERPNRQGDKLSVDTRKNTLAEVKTFGRSLAAGGHIKPDVFDGLKVAGRRRWGKNRRRHTEADRFFATALARAGGGDEGALAVPVPRTVVCA
jgi:hypothetical protein